MFPVKSNSRNQEIRQLSISESMSRQQILPIQQQGHSLMGYEIRYIPKQLLKVLTQRIKKTISNTPRIMIQEEQSSHTKIKAYVQIAPFRLTSLVNEQSCYNTIRQLLKKVTKCVQALIKTYGLFNLTKNMIRLSKNYQVIIWFHQDFAELFPRLIISKNQIVSGHSQTISSILKIFEDAGAKKQLQKLRKNIEFQKSITFFKFILISDRILRNYYRVDKRRSSKQFSQLFISRRKSQSPSLLHKNFFRSDLSFSKLYQSQMQKSLSSFRDFATKLSISDHYDFSASVLFEGNKKINSLVREGDYIGISDISKSTNQMSSIHNEGIFSLFKDKSLKNTTFCKRSGRSKIIPIEIVEDRSQEASSTQTIVMGEQVCNKFTQLQKEFTNVFIGNEEEKFKNNFSELEYQLNQILHLVN